MQSRSHTNAHAKLLLLAIEQMVSSIQQRCVALLRYRIADQSQLQEESQSLNPTSNVLSHGPGNASQPTSPIASPSGADTYESTDTDSSTSSPSPPPTPELAPSNSADTTHQVWHREPLLRRGAHRDIRSMNLYQGMTLAQQQHSQRLDRKGEEFRARARALNRQSMQPVLAESVRTAQRDVDRILNQSTFGAGPSNSSTAGSSSVARDSHAESRSRADRKQDLPNLSMIISHAYL